MADNKPRVCIVGTGAVGTALAGAFAALDYPIEGIFSRELGHARQLATKTGAAGAFVLEDPVPCTSEMVFLCVPDDAIEPTARLLRDKAEWHGKVAAHTSGAQTADALKPLGEAGASLMSFHPVQTFPPPSQSTGTKKGRPDSLFSDIFIGLEGDEQAIHLGKRIVRDFGARSLVLTPSLKPRYHLAASIASNFQVTIMTLACDVLESIGMERHEAIALLRPLVTQTCTNVTSSLPEQVLTGPAARGDEKTLKMHIKAINAHLPQYKEFYGSLLAETLNVAARTGRISIQRVEELKRDLISKKPGNEDR